MGNSFGVLNKQEIKIIVKGLDVYGSTIHQLKLGELGANLPTELAKILASPPPPPTPDAPFDELREMQMAVERMSDLRSWDLGGRVPYSPLRFHSNNNASALIWILDATDRARIGEASGELHRQLASQQDRCPLLVLANRLDSSSAMKMEEITRLLDLRQLKHSWQLVGTSEAELGQGLKWLSSRISLAIAADYLPKLPAVPTPSNPFSCFASVLGCFKGDVDSGPSLGKAVKI